MYIDTHTHISDPSYLGEEEAVIARAIEKGVGKMLLPDVSTAEREAIYTLCAKHPGVLFPMLGLHPEEIKENYKDELYKLQEDISKKTIAIGEIGLDYHYDTTFAAQQKEALRILFELASKWDLPVNVHLRDATEDFITLMKDCTHLHLRGTLHAYSGSIETWRELSRYAYWTIGVGGVVTFKKAHLQEVVKEIPLEYIVLETDSPYLAPTPLRGTRNESANIPLIAAKVAELKGIDINEVEETTTKNALNLYSI